MEEEIKGTEGQEAVPAPVTEPITEPAPTPPEDYKPKFEESEKRYKGLQREFQKVQDQLNQRDLAKSEITSLRAELTAVRREMNALATTLTEDEEWEAEKPKPSKRERYEQLRKPPAEDTAQRDAAIQAMQSQMAKTGQRIAARITKAGLDPNGAEFKLAQQLFAQGQVDDAEAQVDDIITATLKQQEEAKAEAQEKEQTERRELLKSETSTGGPLNTFKQIEEAYAEGKIGFAKYNEALKARQR